MGVCGDEVVVIGLDDEDEVVFDLEVVLHFGFLVEVHLVEEFGV